MFSKNDILISVIVTVYNNEQYIKQCLDTIVPQLNSKIELIIVDDGSLDNTLNICNAITKEKENVIIISNKHNGLSYSRNTGIKRARGKYIVFVDGDDWIDKFYLKELENIILDSQYDVILINTTKFFENKNKYQIENFNFSKLNKFPSKKTEKSLINNNICGRAWRLVTRRQFLFDNNLFFTYGILHEDEEWVTKVLNLYNSIFYSTKIRYFYRKHDNSIMSSKTFKHYNDLLTVAIKLFDFSTVRTNYNKYIRYVVFRCIRNSYGNYNKFSTNEKILLDSWYSKHKIVFMYGIKYSFLLLLCYLIFGYKKGISLYKSYFKVINKRCDVINDIPK